MMYKLNAIRNKANAINMVHLIETNGQNEFIVRFPFRKIMIDEKLFNWNESNAKLMESRMKRFVQNLNVFLRKSNFEISN